MNLQGRDLKLQTQGDDVALLQSELLQLGFAIPSEELGRQLFGPQTEQAVRDFQRSHNIEPTGVVDQGTAQQINVVLDAASYVVRGRITRTDNQQPLAGFLVRANDQDLRREELLGETLTDDNGAYQISYTAVRFARAEKKGPDLFVRVYQPKTMQTLAQSDTRFNAGRQETLDLVIEKVPVERQPTWYERLLAALAPLLQGLPLAELTAADMAFLRQEFAAEPWITEPRLEWLAQSARLARQHDLPVECLFGLAWQLDLARPLALAAFLALEADGIRNALPAAVQALVIPPQDDAAITTLLASLDQLRLEQGLLVQRQVVGQLLHGETEKPLPGYIVRGVHLRANMASKDLGADMTDQRGRFTFTLLTLPPPGAGEPAQPVDRLQLRILNGERQQIHQVEIELGPDQRAVLTIAVPAQALPQPPVEPIGPVALMLHLELPNQLLAGLAEQGIHTLQDIRHAGGLAHLEHLPVAADHPTVRKLDALANLSVLSANFRTNNSLIDKGFDSITAIAATPQERFLQATAGNLDAKTAAQLHVMAKAQCQVLDNILAGIGADVASGLKNGLINPSIEKSAADAIRALFSQKCGCTDCEAAVSPLAYLVDLLNYAVQHVANNGHPISLDFLSAIFHQPFGDLPATCDAVQERVRQARLCVEVLRSHLPDGALSASAEKAHRLNAYTTLLGKLGASYEELRLARTADAETRRALAERLGLDRPERLDALLVKPDAPDAPTAPWLEQVFGLADTTRDPLSQGAKQGDERGQITRWKLNGVLWKRNTDPDGNVYLRISHPADYRVELFRDPSLDAASLVASGEIAHPIGAIDLQPQNRSGLSGVIGIRYTAYDANIVISALPDLLSWRLQRMRTLWQEADRPLDPYLVNATASFQEADLLPIIDPDLIGPDDFRLPFARLNDTDAIQPFDLWLNRRQWVDERLEALGALRTRSDLAHQPAQAVFTSILETMYSRLDYADFAPVTPWSTPLADFSAISQNLAEGKQVDATTARIQNELKLTVESFNRLMELQAQARQAVGLDDAAWEELSSILVQAQKVCFYAAWRQEEQTVAGGQELLSPRFFWPSLQEPVEGDWPPVCPAEEPWIDPDVMTPKELPEPTVGRRARALWLARRATLDGFRDELQHAHEPGGAAGFDATLQVALGECPTAADDGTWLTYLTGQHDDLRAAQARGDQSAIARITTIVAGLHLTLENFQRLMEVQAKGDETAWAEIYPLLVTARKEQELLPATWQGEEAADPAIRGRYWNARKAKLPKWRAQVATRQRWQQARQERGNASIIDPDLIGLAHLRDKHTGQAVATWRWRRDQIAGEISAIVDELGGDRPTLELLDARLLENLFAPGQLDLVRAQCRAVREAPASAPASLLDWTLGVTTADLDALLSALDGADTATTAARQRITQELGLAVTTFRQLMMRLSSASTDAEQAELESILAHAVLISSVIGLAGEQAEGQNIAGRLAQLNLTGAAFARLFSLRNLLAGGETLLPTECEEICSILVQVQKERCYADQRRAEQERTISLSPDFFILPEPPPLQFPPPAPEPLPAWRAAARALRTWETMLQARIDQEQTVISGLQEAVSASEESWLPTLRDALIMATEFAATDLIGKAKQVTDALLIDAQSGGCQFTTRIGQAIETIQGLLWSLRTGQLQDTYPKLTLEAENFDEEWQWLGSYATWRAAMFVFLYPENLLLPSLRRYQTPAFMALVSRLRNLRMLTSEQAFREALDFFNYYRDVCYLRPEVTCSAQTQVLRESTNSPIVTGQYKQLLHLFSISLFGKVYWSTIDTLSDPNYAQTFWEPVPSLKEVSVSRVIGAFPYRTPEHQRLIILITDVQAIGESKLLVTRYNLETGGAAGWESEIVELQLPQGVNSGMITPVQRPSESSVPTLIVHQGGVLYSRALSENCDSWEATETNRPGAETESEEGEEGNTVEDWSIYAKNDHTDRIKTLHAVVENYGQSWCFFLDEEDQERIIRKRFGWSRWLENTIEYATWVGVSIVGQDLYAVYSLIGGEMVQYRDYPDRLGAMRSSRFDSSNVERIISHFGGQPDSLIALEIVGPDGAYRIDYQLEEGTPIDLFLTEIFRHKTSPRPEGPFDLSAGATREELQSRRTSVRRAFDAQIDVPQRSLTYLEEAYYFVPMQIALQLQREGDYTSALDWFRTVYNYNAPSDERKISYLLTREETWPDDHDRFDNWLLDPLNPHEIAATRLNAYTRFTIQALVRCLLEYADAEYTLDTAESVPRARTLYTTALELLDTALPQSPDPCAAPVTALTNEYNASILASAPASAPLWYDLVRGLRNITASKTLTAVIDDLKPVLAASEPWETRLSQALGILDPLQPPPPKTMALAAADQQRQMNAFHTTLLAQPIFDAAMAEAGRSVGNRFAYQYERHVAGGPGEGILIRRNLDTGADASRALIEANHGCRRYQPTLSLEFCLPANPVLEALRLRAELNLYKLRTCRNITGVQRQVEPYAAPTDTVSGLPQIGAGGQLVLPGVVRLQPTPYRYAVLIDRAKQLAQLAGQFEAALLAALEKHDVEYFNLLKARQDVELTKQGVRLQELRVNEAEDGVDLAELQQERAQIQVDTYQEWLEAGLNEHEEKMIDSYEMARNLRMAATSVGAGARAFNVLAEGASMPWGWTQAILAAAAYSAEGALATAAIWYETEAQLQALDASYERREQEWTLQKTIAEQDVRIGEQQITLAQDHVRIVGQERQIAEMQADHAEEVVDFLANKFTNVELYDWMSGVLEGVYSYFLHTATATARLAENQVAFERQETPPTYIQADYWAAPSDMTLSAGTDSEAQNRRGLTGSARLLQDIYQLDQYAFETDRRKLQLTKTISLAHIAPFEFQRFRETGLMTFQTPMELFDRDFPGHYLRLIKRVRTSVVALIPPTAGIHATLSTTGLSKVVIGSDGLFQQINVIRPPDSIALSSPANATGLFELMPEAQAQMLLPFEGIGVDVGWELRMPKPSNQFDYSTIADVLLTIEYTALHDWLYSQQVMRDLDTQFSADRPFSFRHEFADQWYDLHNSIQTPTPMVVRFQTRRTDFSPNVQELRITNLLLHFARADQVSFEVPVTHLRYTEAGAVSAVGGGATSVDGSISTRSGSAGSWFAILGKSPVGEWELALPNTAEMRNRFRNKEIEDILFVITYAGQTPPWPV